MAIAENTSITPAELLKKVRKVEIRTKGLAQHIFSGDYHSAFKGRGMAVTGVRAYQYGDEVRFIDWNVTARYNEPYIKQFEEERELTVILLIDVSGSQLFGTRTRSKNELVTELSAVLAFSAFNNNDRVGVVFFSDKIEMYIPPRKGKNHILHIVRQLLSLKPQSRRTNIGNALQFIARAQKRRSIVFCISDFAGEENYEQQLKRVARQHDLTGIQITDEAEFNLPDVGLLQITDNESGETKWIDTSDKTIREKWRAEMLLQQNKFKTLFARHGADTLQLTTEKAYINILHQFFNRRSHRH